MKKNKLIFINLLLFIVVLVVNTLAVTLPINGKSTSELSDKYSNLFVPAGITFSIWGIIYILLILFIGFQIFSYFNKNSIEIIDKSSQVLFSITNICNILWILSWHYEMILISVFIMLGLLVSLIFLFQKIQKIPDKTTFKYFALQIPISVYLGWISVATIANITAFLVASGWKGAILSESEWTMTMMAIVLLLAIYMLFYKKTVAYSLVFIWAYYGIYLKRISSKNPEIAEFSILFITVIILLNVFFTLKEYLLTKKHSTII